MRERDRYKYRYRYRDRQTDRQTDGERVLLHVYTYIHTCSVDTYM